MFIYLFILNHSYSLNKIIGMLNNIYFILLLCIIIIIIIDSLQWNRSKIPNLYR